MRPRVPEIPAYLAALLALALAPACGSGQDPLTGTWTLSGARCNDQDASSASLPSLTITYAADGSYRGILSSATCAQIRVDGRYARDGLTITETPSAVLCSGSCTSESVCAAGADLSPLKRTYIANAPGGSRIELLQASPAAVCAGGATETQVFTRQ